MTNRKKILIVDNNATLRQALGVQLHLHENFEIAEAATGAASIAAAKKEYFDAILLDVDLPDMDGQSVCRLMRRAGVRVPIFILSNSDTDSDTILGLDAGASDYIVKPFRLRVLLARLRAQLRLHEQSEDAVFTIGPFSFRPSAKLLTEAGGNRKVRLTEKETSILKHLLRAGGNVVRREALLKDLWGHNTDATTRRVETHVYRLRQKIEEDPTNARILITQQGGYRLAF